MFERFTDRARRVVVLAQEESRLLMHSYIGTEHILLGLLNEAEGVGGQALVAQGVDLASVREQIVEIIGRGTNAPAGHIPFTPRAKKILEYSLRESLQLGHNYIGTEHILLGLIREGEGVAAQVLMKLGVDPDSATQTVAELLKVNPQRVELPSERRGSAARCRHPDEELVVSAGPGFRSVRCGSCGKLIVVLPLEAGGQSQAG